MTNFHYCFLMSVVLLAASRETGHARGNDGNQAQFKIESQPSGVEVILGKSTLGKTPLSRNVLHPGLQPLILKKDGYATLSMQVYLEDGAPLDLGTVTLAKNDSAITIWRVGSPHNGGAPPVEIPNDLRAFVKNLGFEVKVTAIAAKDFPEKFRGAVQKGNAPDVIAGSNYLPFQDVMADKDLKSRLLVTRGVLHILDPFVFLVSRSPNHAAARYLALAVSGRNLPRFAWSLEEENFRDRPGQLKSQADRGSLENLNFQAMAAYLANNSTKLNSLAHPEMLRKGGAFGSEAHNVRIAGMKTIYILGNSRIAFVLAKASYWSDELIGCTEIFAVWIKQDQWKLLTISNDPVTLELATKEIPKLGESLREDQVAKLTPAELVTPNGVYPQPVQGQRFGDFQWTPSPSSDVLVEIAEFHYGQASRLFYQPNGQVSTGQLWTTNTPWSWRVWSLGKNGQVVFSKDHFFRQTPKPGRPGA